MCCFLPHHAKDWWKWFEWLGMSPLKDSTMVESSAILQMTTKGIRPTRRLFLGEALSLDDALRKPPDRSQQGAQFCRTARVFFRRLRINSGWLLFSGQSHVTLLLLLLSASGSPVLRPPPKPRATAYLLPAAGRRRNVLERSQALGVLTHSATCLPEVVKLLDMESQIEIDHLLFTLKIMRLGQCILMRTEYMSVHCKNVRCSTAATLPQSL